MTNKELLQKYSQLLQTDKIERKKSDFELFAEFNCIEDLGEQESDNILAFTYVGEQSLELALMPEDVIVFKKEPKPPRKPFEHPKEDSYRAIKMERHLEDVLIK